MAPPCPDDRGALAAAAAGDRRAAGCSALRRSASTSSSGLHHPLQRPARADHQTLVAAFEKKTGITVNVRSDDEDVLANQIVHRGRALARRRVLHRELAAAGVPAGQGPAGRGAKPSRWPRPRPSTTRPRATGSACRPGSACSSTTRALISASQLPTSVMQLADPKYKGKLALAPQARPTSSRSSPRSCARHGTAAHAEWLEALKANAGGHNYPDNETIADEVNRGSRGVRHHQPVLLVPDAGRDRRGAHALADRSLRAARPRLRDRRLRRRGPEVGPSTRPRRRSSSRSWSASRARRSSPTTVDQLRVPDRLRA